MAQVRIYLKGWRDMRLFADAANQEDHPLHAIAERERDRAWTEYEPGDLVYHAITYEVDDDRGDTDVMDEAFELFNVGDEKDDRVREYRQDGRHRSLSVGDVIMIDERAYTVASFGFDRLDVFLRP